MKTLIQIKEYVHKVLDTSCFAVLATESNSRPHASFIAITAINDLFELVFATYRNTSKYNNLKLNENVSILFEYKSEKENIQQEITILTAFGKAKEVEIADTDAIFNAHLLRHPQLKTFLLSSDCALFRVKVDDYQLVLGIDDVNWWNINS